ncbi:hypothetical protein SAMN02745857_00743 [Andreprevotia lacus DSM 23236]|jgi:hypothetical protein|uniref:Uncharacterized protein n=1 Tax=Andreprevotia lacus DSM 23236 TaxID=1121001 RepID=A0A1W1X7W2_9NEIS|nr:hypothetical protein [Andreprevotia lacus]SMC19581.1 hypothetical protein SAMN02745857_00743 [Andreprevotia lacus DSM 23236]
MSLQLPEALAPWRDWLGWFDADRIPQLGDWLLRLQPLLGRYQGRDPGGMPEPDGLDGVQRRGHYERLLSSEWLLAEEVPDEFLRRAAVGEHLFLAPRPRARKAARNITVLFDAGPWQLGAPRLVHLVMWILLARRAATLDAQLQWGILQQPVELFPADSADDLLRMLRARCYRLADEPALLEWQAALCDDLGEIWLLGPEHLQRQVAAHGMYTHALAIGANAECDGLQLALHEPAGRRGLQLPLPEEEIAGKLLRGVFLQNVPKDRPPEGRARFSSARPPVVSAGGHHVAVRNEHVLQVFSPPKTTTRPMKSRKQYLPANAEVLALMLPNKRAAALLRDPSGLAAWELAGFSGHLAVIDSVQFKAPPGRASYLPTVFLHGGDALFVLDTANTLWCWTSHGPVRVQEQDVLALQLAGDRAAGYVWRHASGQLYYNVAGAFVGSGAKFLIGQLPQVTSVLLPAPCKSVRSAFPGCATCRQDGDVEHWQIHPAGANLQPEHRGQPVEVLLQPGWCARALVADAKHDGKLALLIQSPNRQAIALWCDGKIEALHVAQSAIRHITVSADGSTLALLTDGPELIVYSLTTREIRATISGRGEA